MSDWSAWVIIDYHPEKFELDMNGIPTMQPNAAMLDWLETRVGNYAGYMGDITPEKPWRHRPYTINCTHAFFFHREIDAYHFSLVWNSGAPKNTNMIMGSSCIASTL